MIHAGVAGSNEGRTPGTCEGEQPQHHGNRCLARGCRFGGHFAASVPAQNVKFESPSEWHPPSAHKAAGIAVTEDALAGT